MDTHRATLAAWLLRAELRFRHAQKALRQDAAGARESYAEARTDLEAATAATELALVWWCAPK